VAEEVTAEPPTDVRRLLVGFAAYGVGDFLLFGLSYFVLIPTSPIIFRPKNMELLRPRLQLASCLSVYCSLVCPPPYSGCIFFDRRLKRGDLISAVPVCSG